MELQRTTVLNERSVNPDGQYVLYWMQQSQRASNNPALEQAIAIANDHDLAVLTLFALADDYPEARERHYAFMLEGLAETAANFKKRDLTFLLLRGRPEQVAAELGQRAAVIVCDRGYTRHQRAWRQLVTERASCRVIEVDADVVVPVATASGKAEHAARTLRPKILRLRDDFLIEGSEIRPRVSADALAVPLRAYEGQRLDPAGVESHLQALRLDQTVGRVARFKGGTAEARARLRAFLDHRFEGYAERRSEPIARACSELSPYLHFGQISPVELACAARAAGSAGPGDRASFLEELIVRRELAHNFVWYTSDYDAFSCLPRWAQASLRHHAGDPRPHLYDQGSLEAGATHDPYWNAAMHEMRATGYMHNYMRMYWGKKILEWSPDPETAFAVTLAMNNKYFIDGRDPNSFANVGWIYGLHDRPWGERPIFGQVRYMNAKGLERKFDIKEYVAWTRGLDAKTVL